MLICETQEKTSPFRGIPSFALSRYDVYGQSTNVKHDPTNKKQFTGKETDEDSGLQYFIARYYDPETGRFLSKDPVPNGNLYIYCDDNPIGTFDPDGREGIGDWSINFAIGATVGPIGGSIGVSFGFNGDITLVTSTSTGLAAGPVTGKGGFTGITKEDPITNVPFDDNGVRSYNCIGADLIVGGSVAGEGVKNSDTTSFASNTILPMSLGFAVSTVTEKKLVNVVDVAKSGARKAENYIKESKRLIENYINQKARESKEGNKKEPEKKKSNDVLEKKEGK